MRVILRRRLSPWFSLLRFTREATNGPSEKQATLESWLAAPVEKATAITAHASFGDRGPAIEVRRGTAQRCIQSSRDQ